MMDYTQKQTLYGFYQNELRQNILGYWLPRCEDKQFGGFINCYSNDGTRLASYDKYTWSQGRFVWLFSRLAGTGVPMFSDEERARFLALAKSGVDFLMKNCLIAENDWRCSFLMERDGTHKTVSEGAPLDMSIYADCFVILGFGMYSAVTEERAPFEFAKKLYLSAKERIAGGKFNTLPYPLSPCYRAHGIPMIMNNTARELYRAAEKLDIEFAALLRADIEAFAQDILTNFTDEKDVIHEIITSDNKFFPQILGQHQNPGHTIEDVWFLLDAASLCGKEEWKDKIYRIALKALENGWDNDFGGILHFCSIAGGEPIGDYTGVEKETMTSQLTGWGDKLWWIHSEALYSTLRCYAETGDSKFLDWHNRVFEYTYKTFPNTDPNVREWKQIRMRDGKPQDKVVALPVKDPFHIARNLILILELLEKQIYAT